jgi:outer membrane protein OmpA-like peptidoglycan-associated protein
VPAKRILVTAVTAPMQEGCKADHEFVPRIRASSKTQQGGNNAHQSHAHTDRCRRGTGSAQVARRPIRLPVALRPIVGARHGNGLGNDEMACALDPQCTKPFVDRRLRGITATPSVRTPGSFDRTVNFSFDSAELTLDARKELDAVAESLNRPNVAKLDIVINGHTDSVGSPEYNQRLSERRAEAVRQYLITQHGIDGNRLVARGYGKTQLLLPSDPANELNRRVQFQNPNHAKASAPKDTPTPARPAAKSDGL